MLRAWLCIMTFSFAAIAAEAPFWKAKEKAYERVKNGEVLVSVRETKGERNHLKINGGGWANAPRSFVFARALEFDKLTKVSGYVEKSDYDAATQKLDFAINAYGLKAAMQVKLDVFANEDPKRIAYRLLSGPMRGMTGQFTFTEIGRKTEVGITGDFLYDKLPIPKFFVEFGLEVVFQRMAINLRSYVEREFRRASEKAK